MFHRKATNQNITYPPPTPPGEKKKTLPRDSETPLLCRATPRVTTSAGTQTRTPATGQSRRVTSLLPSQPVSGAPRAKVARRSSVAHSQCFWSPNQSSRSFGCANAVGRIRVVGVQPGWFAFLCSCTRMSARRSLPFVNYFPLRCNLAGNNQSLAPSLMLPSSGLGEIHISIVGVWSGD